MLSGDNSILQRATEAKTNTNNLQTQERINLAYHSSLVGGQGEVTETSLESELKKEFNKTALEDGWLDKTSVEGKWRVTIDGVSLDVPVGTEITQIQLEPAEEYGYKDKSGVIEASTLIPGDVINYYYSKTEEPIPCIVMYNDENHGLQVISEDSIRNVIMGCTDNGTIIDPRAVEAFASESPTGYNNTNFEKARWSYNHAIATLNGYAQEYLGLMSVNARCVGAPADNIVLNEDETTNMLTGISYEYFSEYNGKFKNSDENTKGSYSTHTYYSASEDIDKLATLGIIKTPTNGMYWLAHREINVYSHSAGANICAWKSYGITFASNQTWWYTDDHGENLPECQAGFRPIITLRNDIKVEKIRHQDFGSGSFDAPPDD